MTSRSLLCLLLPASLACIACATSASLDRAGLATLVTGVVGLAILTHASERWRTRDLRVDGGEDRCASSLALLEAEHEPTS